MIAVNQTLRTLDQLATEVNAWLDCAKAAEDQACASRISAGKMLAEAKDRVHTGEPGHKSWSRWIRQRIKVPYRDVNNCIATARAPDAIVAGTIARPISRKVPAPLGERALLGRLKRETLSLSAKERIELTEWLTAGSEVQRDRFGNVLDPLPVRLKRVLHRLRKHG
jgi:hypothetical protein